ncbi:MAG: DUF1036 domain-containing protein [Alphaproteobacteria bacterium]|nr:DUF1036 domain-containing protein [Alphaproteobacteria bacterium]
MTLFRSFLAFAVFLSLVLWGESASAALLLCNRTKAPLEAAVGYHEGGIWISEGWWKIEPGLCSRAYNKPLTQRFYFYYARSLGKPLVEGKGPPSWTGKYAFCIDDKAFRITGDNKCEKRDYKTQGFHEIDLGQNTRDYTLNFQ